MRQPKPAGIYFGSGDVRALPADADTWRGLILVLVLRAQAIILRCLGKEQNRGSLEEFAGQGQDVSKEFWRRSMANQLLCPGTKC